MEKADFDALDAEQTESLDAMDRGISTLTARASGGIGDTTVLAQLTKLSPAAASGSREDLLKAGAKIDAFLQEDRARAAQPQATVTNYEFQADGIIDTIKEMKEKMEDERSASRKEESEKKYAYDLLMDQLSTDIEHATEERDAKTTLKAERTEDGAAAEADVVETTATRDADKKYLADLVAQCEQKSIEFDSRQQMRKEELEALTKAIEIMSDGAVSGNAEKHLPTLMQRKQSFGLRRSAGKTSLSQRRVSVFLSEHARKAESRLLQEVAEKVLQGGPFDKVKQMIEGLISKLVQEASEEADHKAWCDEELHTNKNTRDTKSSEVNRLTAQKEKLTAEIQLLTNEIAELEKELSEANASLKEATAQRTKEKAKNEEAIKDAKEAIVAVRQALSVLQSFYAKAAQATALVQSQHKARQSPADDAPPSFSTPYKGMGGSSKGVLGMLEVILADFSRLQAETSSSEAAAADQFEKFSTETTAVIASKKETSAD